jgi:hypothetical protein
MADRYANMEEDGEAEAVEGERVPSVWGCGFVLGENEQVWGGDRRRMRRSRRERPSYGLALDPRRGPG